MTEKQKKFYKALIYDKINILEVANRYNIKRASNKQYHCPNTAGHAHGDTNASMGIKGDLGLFNCFTCGMKGKHEKLVMLACNITEEQALERIIKDFNINVSINTPLQDKTAPEPAKSFLQEPAKTEELVQTDKLFLRSLIAETKRRCYYKSKEDISTRPVIEDDIMFILNSINKNYNVKSLEIANVLISDSPKALVFPQLNTRGGYLLKSNEKTNDYIIVEGRTDYASAVCLLLNEKYNVFMRSNKTAKFELPDTCEKLIFILDSDDDIQNALKYLQNKLTIYNKIKALKFTDNVNGVDLSMYDFKDLSDYHASNMGLEMLLKLFHDLDYILINDDHIEGIEKYRFFDNALKIDTFNLYKTLDKQGFNFLKEQDDKRQLGRLHKNTIEYFDEKEVHSWCLNKLIYEYPEQINDEVSREDLQKALFYIPNAFELKKFNILPERKINPHRDTHNAGYIYLKDYYLKVSSKEIEKKEYSKLKRPIFKKSIHENLDFKLLPYMPERNALDTYGEYSKDCIFDLFLQRVCTAAIGAKLDFTRYEALKSAIGYMLHKYRDESLTKAVVFSENNISNDPHGQTGKGLILRLVSKLLTVCNIDGKNLNMGSTFSFSHMERWTDILAFNDVTRNFNFEKLFSLITDGFVYQKKNVDVITLPYDISPKIYISTNSPITKRAGGSFESRIFEMELYCYFSSSYTPKKEFGHMFFLDWDQKELNKFYSFLLHCLQLFLENSLMSYHSTTVIEKKITADVGLGGYTYLHENIKDKFDAQPGRDEIYMNKENALIEFRDKTDNDRLTKTRVTQALSNYAVMYNYDFKSSAKQDGIFCYKFTRKKTIKENQLII